MHILVIFVNITDYAQDGLRGASVRWDRFTRVANLRRFTLQRQILQWLLHSTPLYLLLGLSVLTYDKAAGAIFIVAAIIVAAVSPFALKRLYGGKFWYTQVSSLPIRVGEVY